ncbi:MAG: Na/Pi cotransporter family protein, partial [Paracoccaceae bacterium]
MSSSSPLLFLMHVAGSVALLIWAVRLVRTGVERGWQVALRRLLRRGGESRILSAISGTAAAVVLQSSTAVAILSANFVAAGTLTVMAGLAVVLGADLGSAIVARILMTRADWLVPLLLVIGVALFQKSTDREWRMAGRCLIGLALIFVSLTMIRTATEPLSDAPMLANAMRYLAGDPITAFVMGALIAWAMHSSVAAVLLFITLATAGPLPTAAAVAMVLGANLGGAIIAFVLTLGAEIEARRVITGNLLMRGGGALLALLALSLAQPDLAVFGASPAKQVINLHLLFNLVILIIGLPLTGPLIRLTTGLIKPQAVQAELQRVSALDPAALAVPDRALAAATREILQMGEAVESMLRSVISLYASWDGATADAITKKEEAVDRLHLNIKLYLARLQKSDPGEAASQRGLDLAEMAVNLEQAGNAIAQNMVSLAERLDKKGLSFSQTGLVEISDFHDRVLANAQSALNVLITQSPDAARALVAEKDRVRDVEQQLQRSHLERLKEGRSDSIETSNLHQETLRALKQVNTAFT